MKINRETFEIEFYDKDGNYINSIGIGSTRISNRLFVEMLEELENELIDYKEFDPDEYKRQINCLVENSVMFLNARNFLKNNLGFINPLTGEKI